MKLNTIFDENNKPMHLRYLTIIGELINANSLIFFGKSGETNQNKVVESKVSQIKQ